MAIIGWLALVALMGSMSCGWLVLAFNGLGKYNIGGVPNRRTTKVLLLTLGAFLAYAWYVLGSNAPFTIALK